MGIEGDRGPSSLDWAIQERERTWGVTLLQAAAEMDAGPIWATRTFPMRCAPKSSLYRHEVIEAAVECLWETLDKFSTPGFEPRPLDYRNPGTRGRERPAMTQADRRIDWSRHDTDEILARIHAADGVPGVLDEIGGAPVLLHNAFAADGASGRPGDILAISDSRAICRATTDGAVWISHAKAKAGPVAGIKLPAAVALRGALPEYLPRVETPAEAAEIRLERRDGIVWLSFDFHNGAMNTRQCEELRDAFRAAAGGREKIIVLMGGSDH